MVGTGKDVPVLKHHCGKVQVKQYAHTHTHKHTHSLSLSLSQH